MKEDTFFIDDRPWRFLPEEEKRRRAEEAERILGPERCKQIDEEIKACIEAKKKKQRTL